MSTHDYIIADGSGSAVLADINNAFQALVSNNKSSSVSGTLYDGMWRLNDSTTPWQLEMYTGAVWIVVLYIDATNGYAYPFGWMAKESGIWLSNNSSDADHDIDFSAGSRLTQNNYTATLSGTMTKRLDAAWAAGSGNGGLDTGSIAADTSYNGYVIIKDSDLSTDAILSASATGPTMPSGYTEYRRRGAFITDSSANILPFTQFGTLTWLSSPITESTSAPGSSTLFTIGIPLGIVTRPIIGVMCVAHATQLTYVGFFPYPSAAIRTDFLAIYPAGIQAGQATMMSNTSAQIRLGTGTYTPTSFALYLHGWDDYQLALRA